MRKCICPGSFDPITNGHLDIIRRASLLFDKVYVTVLTNSSKQPFFTVQQRMDMIAMCCKDIPGVEIESFDGLLVDYAKQKDAIAMVRGLRAVSDFEYEMQMASLNRQLCNDVETVFLMSANSNAFLSSRMVREIGILGGDITSLVPPQVASMVAASLQKGK